MIVLTGWTNLFLCLLKSGKSHKQVFIHMFLSKEVHCPLVHLSAVSNITVLLFKTSILDPVLHFGVNDDKCSGVKEFLDSKQTNKHHHNVTQQKDCHKYQTVHDYALKFDNVFVKGYQSPSWLVNVAYFREYMLKTWHMKTQTKGYISHKWCGLCPLPCSATQNWCMNARPALQAPTPSSAQTPVCSQQHYPASPPCRYTCTCWIIKH